MVDGICFTGAFSHPLSMGQSFGNHIRMCSGGGAVTPNILGGTPQYVVETVGLFGVMPGIDSAFFKTGFSVLQGGGHKHQRVAGCTTAAAVNATCGPITLTWTTAFRDANYTLSCTGTGTGNQGFIQVTAKVGASVTLFGVSSAAVAFTVGTFECIADHD